MKYSENTYLPKRIYLNTLVIILSLWAKNRNLWAQLKTWHKYLLAAWIWSWSDKNSWNARDLLFITFNFSSLCKILYILNMEKSKSYTQPSTSNLGVQMDGGFNAITPSNAMSPSNASMTDTSVKSRGMFSDWGNKATRFLRRTSTAIKGTNSPPDASSNFLLLIAP